MTSPISAMRCLRRSSGSSLVMTCEVELGELLAQHGLELLAQVFGRVDVAAEDDRVEAVLIQSSRMIGGGKELLVVSRMLPSFSQADRRSWRSCRRWWSVQSFHARRPGSARCRLRIRSRGRAQDSLLSASTVSSPPHPVYGSGASLSRRVLSIFTPAAGLDMTPRSSASAVQYWTRFCRLVVPSGTTSFRAKSRMSSKNAP